MFQKKPAALPDGIEDLEDMCKTSEKHRPTLSAPSHKKGDLIDEIPLQEGECIGQEDIPPIEKSLNEDPENEARSKTPDKEVDYEAWVEYKKLKRKETREQRKRQRLLSSPCLRNVPKSQMWSIFFPQVERLSPRNLLCS